MLECGWDFAGGRGRESTSDSWEDALDFGGESTSRQSARGRGRGRVAMAGDNVEPGAAEYAGRGRGSSRRVRGRLTGAATSEDVEGEDGGPRQQNEGGQRGRGRSRGRCRLGLGEGGRVLTKGKNFIVEEERQLTRSVMAVL
jgi:hypothetical protein